MFTIKKLELKLQTKITLLIIVIVTVSIYTTTFLTTRWLVANISSEMHTNLMNIAKVIANSPNVVEEMKTGIYQKNAIQPYVQTLLANTEKVEIIVVADMNGIRYAHPNPERLGQKFVGGDERRVLEQGDAYISEAIGTLGRSLRAFVPVYDPETHEQLGFVMTGALSQTISVIKRQRIVTSILVSFIGLFLGMIGALLLANNVKKILLGLEPEEISKLYIEKQGILDAIHEGIIAIDEKENITVMNDSAKSLLGLSDVNTIGKNVMEVFPTSRLPEVLKTGEGEYDREQVIEDTIIITNRVPIKDGNKTVGAIATFRDKTIITRLAEEVTGVKQIVDSLRANTHEFMNKLHVILGLIEIDELEEAKKYIINVKDNQQQIVSLIMKSIKDPSIVGLLLGKFSRAKELGTNLSISEDSCLDKRNDRINSNTLVTIIGNLIENAMEAISMSNSEEKNVDVRIKEYKKEIVIEVKDTGMGIKEKNLPYIFNRGFSTKEHSRGLGLALVKTAVESLGGHIEVTTTNDETRFVVILPKGEEL